MYTEEIVSISRADDGGYVIGVRVKKKKKKVNKGEICCGSDWDSKTLLAKDLDEVNETLGKILPNMKPGGMEEDEFNKAFKEAIKED
ncbi:hypothetical protein KAR91_49675 [Candidatus Pacearchaeota archaeon]|nr:hypothetical protein [Candidatus Pacearchaeota archaeon]